MADLHVEPNLNKAFELGLEAFAYYQSEQIGVHTRDSILELGQHVNGLLAHKDESDPVFKYSLPPIEENEAAAFDKLKECCEQGVSVKATTGPDQNVESLAVLNIIVQYLIKLVLDKFGK